MVSIEKQDDQFIFEIMGMHKLWAFKRRIKIPAAHIVKAYRGVETLSFFTSLRMPGTYIPNLITAGTFYQTIKPDFWDVVNEHNSIIVELREERYRKLIIEVENPEAAVEMLNGE